MCCEHRVSYDRSLPVIVANEIPWHEETENSESCIYRQPSGCAFSWKTAYTVPLFSAQKDACPLKKAEFDQLRTLFPPSANVCVIEPGIVEGMNGANRTPFDVEYVYVTWLIVAVS